MPKRQKKFAKKALHHPRRQQGIAERIREDDSSVSDGQTVETPNSTLTSVPSVLVRMSSSRRGSIDDRASVGQMNPAVLIAAIQDKDMHLIQVALDQGMNLNVPALGEEMQLPIHAAAGAGDVELLELLWQKGASVHKRDTLKRTALYYACQSGSLDSVKFLCDKGANIHTRAHDGSTCLMSAVTSDNPALVRYLIDRGAKLNAIDVDGDTALHIACRTDSKDSIWELIKHNAIMNITNKVGHLPGDTQSGFTQQTNEPTPPSESISGTQSIGTTSSTSTVSGFNTPSMETNNNPIRVEYTGLRNACHVAIAEQNVLALQSCLAKCSEMSIQFTDEHMMSFLELASFFGNVEIGKLLIPYASFELPLLIAVEHGHPAFVQLLLHHGADYRQLDLNGMSCIERLLYDPPCSRNIVPEMIKMLIRFGVSIDVVGKNGQTSLHVTASDGYECTVRQVILCGADVNRQDNEGNTPAYLAVRNGHHDVLKTLVERGAADLTICQRQGRHPLFLAVLMGNQEAVSYLLSRNAPVDLALPDGTTPLWVAVNRSLVEIAQLLLEKNANPNGAALNGLTILQFATTKSNAEIICLLLEYGADVNQTPYGTLSPLQLACQVDRMDIISFLLAYHADVNQTSPGSESALITALQYNASKEVVQMLIQSGADITKKSLDGATPLHEAIRCGRAEAVELLLENGADPMIRDNHERTAVDFAKFNEPAILGYIRGWIASKSKHTTANAESTNDCIMQKMEAYWACPITLETMKDPVFAPDGHTYERSAITEWIRARGTSPITQQRMVVQSLVANRNLKMQIEAFCEERNTRQETSPNQRSAEEGQNVDSYEPYRPIPSSFGYDNVYYGLDPTRQGGYGFPIPITYPSPPVTEAVPIRYYPPPPPPPPHALRRGNL